MDRGYGQRTTAKDFTIIPAEAASDIVAENDFGTCTDDTALSREICHGPPSF
jgi:hypothetical protein